MEVDVPDGMMIDDVLVSKPDPQTYTHYTLEDHDLRSAETVTRFNVPYISDPPTIREPVFVISEIGETDGPISCEYTAMFQSQKVFGSDIEYVEGTFEIYTELHSRSLPWERCDSIRWGSERMRPIRWTIREGRRPPASAGTPCPSDR